MSLRCRWTLRVKIVLPKLSRSLRSLSRSYTAQIELSLPLQTIDEGINVYSMKVTRDFHMIGKSFDGLHILNCGEESRYWARATAGELCMISAQLTVLDYQV